MSGLLHIPQTPRAKTALDWTEGDDRDEHGFVRAPAAGAENDSGYASSMKPASPVLGPDSLRQLSASPISDAGSFSPVGRLRPSFADQPATWRGRISKGLRSFWEKNKSPLLVAFAQFFGALMNLAARLLETGEQPMHPFQVLFARMSLTALFSSVYMYWRKVPDFPFGSREVRAVLVIRGISGFFGIYGMWSSIMYLPLAEATVITFLAPSLAGYVCHVVLHDPYSRMEQIQSVIAFVGVVLIARPSSIFASSPSPPEGPVEPIAPIEVRVTNSTITYPHLGEDATPYQRVIAVGMGLMGVMGAAGAFTSIRWIGKRAHPLISVNYFSVFCVMISTTVLCLAPVLDIGQPAIQFGLPHALYQWFLLFLLGSCGFIMQFMLTSGLGGEKSNRATAMTYTQMLFAAGFDKVVFGHEMSTVSLIGCGLIFGSALWVAIAKKPVEPKAHGADLEALGEGYESVPMLPTTGEQVEGEELAMREADDGEEDGIYPEPRR